MWDDLTSKLQPLREVGMHTRKRREKGHKGGAWELCTIDTLLLLNSVRHSKLGVLNLALRHSPSQQLTKYLIMHFTLD